MSLEREDGSTQVAGSCSWRQSDKRRENWDRYIDALEYQLKFTEGREAKADMLITIAQTYEHKLSDETMAYIAYTRAFREVPGHEYIQNELERLAGRLGRFEELLGLYEEEIEKIRTSEEEIDNRDALLVNLHMQAAKLYEEYLQDLPKATEHLRALTEIDSHNREALSRLERIYSVTQQWQELIEVSAHEARNCRRTSKQKEDRYFPDMQTYTKNRALDQKSRRPNLSGLSTWQSGLKRSNFLRSSGRTGWPPTHCAAFQGKGGYPCLGWLNAHIFFGSANLP